MWYYFMNEEPRIQKREAVTEPNHRDFFSRSLPTCRLTLSLSANCHDQFSSTFDGIVVHTLYGCMQSNVLQQTRQHQANPSS